MKRTMLWLILMSGVVFSAAPALAGVTCTLTCPAFVTQSNDVNQCGAVVNYPTPVGVNCGTVTPTIPSGSFFPVGTTLVTVNTDATTTCSFNITVNDTQPPSITCPADINQDVFGPTAVNYSTTASDNCPGLSLACVPPSGSVFSPGTTISTCTAADSSNNTATCIFSVKLTAVPLPTPSPTPTPIPTPVLLPTPVSSPSASLTSSVDMSGGGGCAISHGSSGTYPSWGMWVLGLACVGASLVFRMARRS
jgi:HYR domain-containing protein